MSVPMSVSVPVPVPLPMSVSVPVPVPVPMSVSVPVPMSVPVQVIMYYDEYERKYGDGFYPQIDNFTETMDSWTKITFNKIIFHNKKVWFQMNDGCINGLDGDCGTKLLYYLNMHSNSNIDFDYPVSIYDSNGLQLYPKK